MIVLKAFMKVINVTFRPKEIVKMELCEHGNSHHCQSCEVKQLKYVIEEQQKEIESLTSRFHKQADYIINLEAKIERLEEYIGELEQNKLQLRSCLNQIENFIARTKN